MDVIIRGMRNAFRNATRAISIVSILGLSIGLSLVMLIANQAVGDKIQATFGSIGNTIHISPAGYTGGNSISSALTNDQLKKVSQLAHIKKVSAVLNGSLQPEGTTSNPVAAENDPHTVGKATAPLAGDTAVTSLQMPFKIDCAKGNCTGGSVGLTNSGGDGTAPKLPANFSLPVTVIGTNSPLDPAVINASKLEIISGDVIDGAKDTDAAMISSDLAAKNNLKVGSTFTAYKKTVKVAAIFTADTRTGNSSIILPLPTLQRLTKQTDLITSGVATVDSLENLAGATAAVQKALGTSADVNSPLDQAKKAIEPLRSVQSISLYSLIGSVVAGAIIILLTMIMIVRERKREIGVFKAIGFSNLRIMLQFAFEALTFTVLAALIGLVIGIVAGNPVTSALVQNTNTEPGIGFDGDALNNIRDIRAIVDWHIIAYGFGAAVGIALVGSVLASFFIAKVRPAEVLRSE